MSLLNRVKSIVPRSLYGRAALILTVPIIVVQLVVVVVFFQRHFSEVTVQMTNHVVQELRIMVNRVNNSENLHEALAELNSETTLRGYSLAAPTDDVIRYIRITDLTGPVIEATIRRNVPEFRAINLDPDAPSVLISLMTKHGLIRVEMPRNKLSARNPHQLLVLMGVTGILMTGVAYLFLRNQLRPIRKLSEAAEAFGKGENLPYFPTGSTEVRAAGEAFVEMRQRIERQIEQRTLMLSGVSHDLRTPLTRLKLGLSMIEDESREELEGDVREMNRLVDRFLSFSRADARDDPYKFVDPTAFIHECVEKARRADRVVQIGQIDSCAQIKIRAESLERALDNLIGNAVRYGNQAIISFTSDATELSFIVEDDGPGIPTDDRERALKPFIRLDKSRNQDKGSGVGLGLAIAHDIVKNHGGRISLGKSDAYGGLSATLILPK